MTASTNLRLERIMGKNTFVLAGCKMMDMDSQADLCWYQNRRQEL